MSTATSTNRPPLSLCMIVRDSARTLSACLASITPWVDELIVVDTGSLDESREIAAQFGAKVFDFAWCDDFSAARNESLRLASGEWLFWMDSDDTIDNENGAKLRELAQAPLDGAPLAYVMQVHCPGDRGACDTTVVDHVKMFRNYQQLRFEGRIHEQILPAIRRLGGEIAWTDVFVVHSGSDRSPEARRRKQQRDLRLLELELDDHPGHPFALFNLGMTYADIEDHEKAVDALRRSLSASHPTESHVRKLYALLVGSLVQLEQFESAAEVCKEGRELFPDDAELLFRQGVVAHHCKKLELAVESYRGAIDNGSKRHFMSRDVGITGFKARHNLAVVYRDMERPELAELNWRLALAERADFKPAWDGLVEILIHQRKFTTLEVELEQLEGNQELRGVTARGRGLLAIAKGDVRTAKEYFRAAVQKSPADIDLRRRQCHFLYQHGESEEAIAALDALCQLAPDDGAAWHNLGTAYQRDGCAGLAVNCFLRSLAVRPDSVQTHLQLGYAQIDLGRIDAARRTLKRAADIAPQNRSVQAALVNLQQRDTAEEALLAASN